MKKPLSLETWKRREHYEFFSKFDEPFFGITTRIDCTKAYQQAKASQSSFFLHYLFRALKACNSIENFNYHIIDGQPYLFDQVNASATIAREDGTFGFSDIIYYEDESLFIKHAKAEIKRTQESRQLMPANAGEHQLHVTTLPWIDFTSLSHARQFSFPDSCPKIAFGKMISLEGKREMAVSIHGHHALMDGAHIGLFVQRFQGLMNTATQ